MQAIAPAHGHVIEDPTAVLDEYVAHRLERERQILRLAAGARADGADTDVVEALYADIPEGLLDPVAR